MNPVCKDHKDGESLSQTLKHNDGTCLNGSEEWSKSMDKLCIFRQYTEHKYGL